MGKLKRNKAGADKTGVGHFSFAAVENGSRTNKRKLWTTPAAVAVVWMAASGALRNKQRSLKKTFRIFFFQVTRHKIDQQEENLFLFVVFLFSV